MSKSSLYLTTVLLAAMTTPALADNPKVALDVTIGGEPAGTEFALAKVRPTQIEPYAARGEKRGKVQVGEHVAVVQFQAVGRGHRRRRPRLRGRRQPHHHRESHQLRYVLLHPGLHHQCHCSGRRGRAPHPPHHTA